MKALVLFSGGVDSTTCLGLAIDKYGAENVTALSVYYGQKHSKELEAAEKIAAYYGVSLRTLDLAVIFADSDCSLLKGSEAEIPKESYADQLKKTDGKPVSTYVPFRNGLFLSCAASIALSEGCSEIWYGAHSDDAAGNAYPDCSSEFNDSINRAIKLGSGGLVTCFNSGIELLDYSLELALNHLVLECLGTVNKNTLLSGLNISHFISPLNFTRSTLG